MPCICTPQKSAPFLHGKQLTCLDSLAAVRVHTLHLFLARRFMDTPHTSSPSVKTSPMQASSCTLTLLLGFIVEGSGPEIPRAGGSGENQDTCQHSTAFS